MKASLVTILGLSAFAVALPGHWPPYAEINADDINDADITTMPSAPSYTPSREDIMELLARPTPLHTTVLIGLAAQPSQIPTQQQPIQFHSDRELVDL
jgi:hypothetical protein